MVSNDIKDKQNPFEIGVLRHIKPYGVISEPTVNQRVLGSSPRGGATKAKATEYGGFFVAVNLN